MARNTVEFQPSGEEKIKKLLHQIGQKIVAYAKRNCPVDTGRLRASITYEIVRYEGKWILRVGTNVNYAPFVEYGTEHNPKQPFL